MPVEYVKNLVSTIQDKEFPWFFVDSSVDEQQGKSYSIFTHSVYDIDKGITSSLHEILIPIAIQVANHIKCKIKLFRIQVNLLLPQEEVPHINNIHRDIIRSNKSYLSFLYYLNDADGDTVFYNEDLSEINRIKPKQNMCVVFNSKILHAAAKPCNSYNRITINFMIEIDNADPKFY